MVGAAISKAGAERTTPLATATLVLAANAPDVDIFGYVRGEYFALAFRRGITHGVPGMVVLALLVTGVVLGWDRWVRLRRDPDAPPARAGPILLWSTVGLLTHSTFDWMNTYGMRWGLPIDGSWSYRDALFIIDPWLWLVLGGAVFLASSPGRWGLVGWGPVAALAAAIVFVSPVGPVVKAAWATGLLVVVVLRWRGRPVSDVGRLRFAATAGAAAIIYIALMVAADARATVHVLRAAHTAGLEVVDVMVAPQPANPFVAEVEVLTADSFVPGVHRWIGGERVRLFPAEAVSLRSGPDGMEPARLRPIVDAARGDPDAAHWLVWSRYPYVHVDADGDGWLVRFSDARYDGRGGTGGLSGVTVHLGPDLTPVRP